MVICRHRQNSLSLFPAPVSLGATFVRKRPSGWNRAVRLVTEQVKEKKPNSYKCSPSLTVAFHLWIWTCSSCASEETWWWDSTGIEALIRHGQNDSNALLIRFSHTSFIFCSMTGLKVFPWRSFNLRVGAGDVLWVMSGCSTAKRAKRKTLQF